MWGSIRGAFGGSLWVTWLFEFYDGSFGGDAKEWFQVLGFKGLGLRV